MRATAATVQIPGGEVSDLVADHLEKDGEWCCCELRRQANNPALEVDSP
jgi:hypothetical protein